MSEKQFEVKREVYQIYKDLTLYEVSDRTHTFLIYENAEELTDLLNEQHEQIQFLNMKYAERTSIIGEQSLKIENLEKENKHIKQTIKDMINTERTELGRSVLKQLWEQIQ